MGSSRLLLIECFFLLSLSLNSCSKNDDTEDVGNKDLVGVWTQYHTGGSTAWYIGLRLDGDGKVYYTEWDTKRSADWGTPGKWNATKETLTINAPDGNKVYSSHYILSEDGNSLILESDKSGNLSTLSGTFKKDMKI